MRISKYVTLILMYPDGSTHRFSLRCGLVAFAAWMLVLLPILGAAGVYFGWERWALKDNWELEREELLFELDRCRAEAERHALTADAARAHAAFLLAENEAQAAEPVSLYTAPVDKDIIRIEHPVFRQIGPQVLRLIMEMYSTMPPSPISGRVMFSLFVDGKVYPLTHEDTAFQIIRYKKVAIKASLPPLPVDLSQASVVVEVLTAGEVIFRKTYPLEH